MNTAKVAAFHCRMVFALLLWRWLAIFNHAGRNIDHALCPLVQVARAFGVLFSHDAIMEQLAPSFQGKIRLPYSNWPTTDLLRSW